MNRSLASNTKAVSKAVKAGSRAAADSRSRVSRVKNPDRVASTAVSKSRGKADRVASAKASAGAYDQFFPGLGRGFFCREFFRSRIFSAQEFFRPGAFRRRATLTSVATGYLEDAATNRGGRCYACIQLARRLGRSSLGRSILASRRETDLANG